MHEIHLDVIDSTQTYAKEHSQEFSKEGITCITAEEQTKGRGRYQRKWTSPRGVSLNVTFYFHLPKSTPHLISLAQIATLSLAKALLQEGLKPQIKWPNDLRLSEKKVSGILCETRMSSESVEMFLGVGINVNLSPEQVAQIDQPATSLLIETGKPWDKTKLLKKLQTQFSQDLELFKKKGFAPFHAQFEQLLAFKGQTIRCDDGKKVWVGILHSLTEEGQLKLLLPDQTLHTISSGDIQSEKRPL